MSDLNTSLTDPLDAMTLEQKADWIAFPALKDNRVPAQTWRAIRDRAKAALSSMVDVDQRADGRHSHEMAIRQRRIEELERGVEQWRREAAELREDLRALSIRRSDEEDGI